MGFGIPTSSVTITVRVKLSPQPRCRRNVLLHGELARPTQQIIDRPHGPAARVNPAHTFTALVSHRCLGGAAGTHALPADSAARRHRLFLSLAGDQNGFLKRHRPWRASPKNLAKPKRARHPATPLLGTHHSRPTGLQRSHGLRSLQPRQARTGLGRQRMAVLDLSARNCSRPIPPSLGRRRQCERKLGRTRMSTVGRSALWHSDDCRLSTSTGSSTVCPIAPVSECHGAFRPTRC